MRRLYELGDVSTLILQFGLYKGSTLARIAIRHPEYICGNWLPAHSGLRFALRQDDYTRRCRRSRTCSRAGAGLESVQAASSLEGNGNVNEPVSSSSADSRGAFERLFARASRGHSWREFRRWCVASQQ